MDLSRAGGEAVFIPKEASNEEDAGYLMTFVHDLNNESAEFVVRCSGRPAVTLLK